MGTISIDAPVGLRWRSMSVTNNSSDQAKLINLLGSIGTANGGKKEAWAVAPTSGPDGTCSKVLADAIWDFQTYWKGQGEFKLIDGVVDPGMHTLEKMNELAVDSTPAAPPSSAPPPPTVPLTNMLGGVQVGPIGPKDLLVLQYYDNCPRENIGDLGQIVISSSARRFQTFEDLIDGLQTSTEPHQVIVNHGSPKGGLLIPFAKGVPFDETGQVIGYLSQLADREEQNGKINPTNPTDRALLDSISLKMKMFAQSVVIRIVHKLVELRKKGVLALHLRACNLTNFNMVKQYKSAFGIRSIITFHPCRLLFVEIAPADIAPGKHVVDFSNEQNQPTNRVRTWIDDSGLISNLMIRIIDNDGHENVTPISHMDKVSSTDLWEWAADLVGEWKDTDPAGFIVPVMWDNGMWDGAYYFYCPTELGWSLYVQTL
jgi:hypothetical protein